MGVGRGTFGPTVLVGLASGALAAVAGNRPWAEAGEAPGSGGEVAAVATAVGRANAPLATALALVVLAAWGVLLVSRGRFRRVMAWFGMVAAVALLAAVIAAFLAAPDAVADAYAPYGLTDVEVDRTAWSFVALLGALGALGAAGVAVREVGRWPQMGKRYDAPGDPPDAGGAEERGNLDLWKAIDEGRDPTAGTDR